jgi:hypothetical protein
MKLSQLAAKPQLIKLIIDEESFVEEYGEPIEFWTWDRQPIEVFMKLANQDNQNTGSLVEIVRTLILDENGKQIISGDAVLPSKILIAVISKVVETLGK